MRILIIEDNLKMAASLKRGLEQEGYAADSIQDGVEGERRLIVNRKDYDVLVLDISLPNKNGIEICRSLREKKIMIPVLMLTARDTVKDRVLGLDSGADDYLIKPFAFEELLSRIRALTRRPQSALSPELPVGDIKLNPATRDVSRAGEKIDLTLTEFHLLEYFMRHPNEVLNRQTIIDHVWDFDFNSLSRVMDVHINNLRNKLNAKKHGSKIETVRGIGYRLRA